jgi:hypothetical protein
MPRHACTLEKKSKLVDMLSMKSLRLCLLALLLSSPTLAEELVRPTDQIILPLAEGWLVGGDSIGFPIELVNEDLTGYFQVYRNTLTKDDAIADGDQLRRAVDDIISDVIMELPNAQVLTNTGYQRDNRVSFVLEFTSDDTANFPTINHRLMGVLYRLPNDNQLLFTLWGKGSSAADVQSDFRFMQAGFRYTGESADYPFAQSNRLRWYLTGGVGLALILIVFLRRRIFK